MEKKLKSARAVKPGAILRKEIDARGWTQVEFAEIIQRPVQVVNEILSGKKIITPETAIEIAHALDTTPQLWLNLETAYRLHNASINSSKAESIKTKSKLFSNAPMKELQKRGYLPRTDNLDELTNTLCSFLGVKTLGDAVPLSPRFRQADIGEVDENAVIAWIRCASINAEKIDCSNYNHKELKTLIPKLKKYSETIESTQSVLGLLKDVGVRLVFIKHFQKTYLDGAAFWVDDKPIIVLSLRYDRLDHFWFTLMHELAHIISDGDNGSYQASHYDENIFDPKMEDEEVKANKKAQNWLIAPASFKRFVKVTKPYYSRESIVTFAQNQQVHPSIVLGRLRYEKEVSYSHLSYLNEKVRHLFDLSV